jgi:SAM-dependent methyltransferase
METKPIYSEYDFFASIYNKYWGNFYKHLYPMLKEEILVTLSEEDRILDLCCGTGQLVNHLNQDGFTAIGLDGSKEMLKAARENNNKDVEFIHADIRDFTLTDQFKLVTCTYDSLNHLMCLEDLEKAVSNVWVSLKKGGIFLFDMNMEKSFSIHWNDSFSIEEDDYHMDAEATYSSVSKIGELTLTIFSRDKTQILAKNTIKEKCYSREEILKALSKAGFVNCNEKVDDSGKTLFIARK